MSLARRAASSQSVAAGRAVADISDLFARRGSGDYVGEKVSQLEHALQAADLAARSGLGEDAVLAALLHDCGHMVGLDDPSSPRMDDCGLVNHEGIGRAWVRGLGFSERVATLVERHVDAKRYLCCVQPGYHARLSDASKTTLRFQGGPMTPEEAARFEQDDLFRIIIAMRQWDEAAKVPRKVVPPLEAYWPTVEAHILRSGDGGRQHGARS